MRDRKLNRLFARWRERGDAEALGEVFDLTAPELLRVALHVVRDPAEADDLLQATFLTAIERSASFDASEPLMPWLVGVLVRHAHESRRKRERTPDEARLASPRAHDPHETAVNAELSVELRKALDELPERDRVVLIPFLYEGKRAVEIAAQARRPAGTVRMQIHRGLDRLRRALPAGLSLGVAATVVGGRGLAAVRAEVLRNAALSTPIAAASAGAGLATTLTLGGLVVTKKLAVGAFALALVLGAGWWMRSGSERSSAREPAQPVAAVAPRASDATEVAALSRESAAQESARIEAAPASEPPSANAAYLAALAGVTGRLLHSDARAAADIEVSLLEFRPSFLSRSLHETLGEGQPQLDLAVCRARTDAEGRFRLDGARALAMHGLGIDLGGPRASLRVLDVALRPGEHADLGDVVLNPTATVSGRVVDESGSPIAGARVRAAVVTKAWIVPGIEQYRPGAYVVLCEGRPSVFAMPEWLSSNFERLPIPTARTDMSGEFRLDGVPAGDVTALVDTDGRPVRLIEVGELAGSSSTHLGDVVVERGVTVRGRVLDSEGAPIAGAEVAVGAGPAAEEPKGRGFIMAFAAGRTDAEGRFERSGLPSNGPACVVARSHDAQAWTVVRGLDVSGEVEVRLPPTSIVRVRMRDDAGQSLASAELWITSDPIGLGVPTLFGAMHRIAVTQSEGGVLELPALSRGTYFLAGRAAGYAVATTRMTVEEAADDVELVFAPARTLHALVRDRATGTPIAGADVSVCAVNDVSSMARGRTGADGKVALEGVPHRASEPTAVRVEHPGYATMRAPFDAQVDQVHFELDRGGELLAHVRSAGEAPQERYMFLITAAEGSPLDREFPTFVATDASGDARVACLAPGRYKYQLLDPWLRQDVVALAKSYRVHDRGDFVIESGSPTELTVELRQRAVRSSGEASIAGRLTIDGQPAAGLSIGCAGVHAQTDEQGRFVLENVRADADYLVVSRRGTRGSELLRTVKVELRERERCTLELDCRTYPVQVEVRGPRGEAVANVPVTIHPSNVMPGSFAASIETDADGRAQLKALQAGPHIVLAEEEDFGAGRAEIAVVEGGATPLAIVTLERYVPCAGRVVVSSGASQAASATLHVRHNLGVAGVSYHLKRGQSMFELREMRPGKHSAWWFTADEIQLGPIEFELPAEGNTQLVLEFSGDR